MDQNSSDTPRKRAPGGGRKPKFSTPAVTWTVSGSEEQKAKFYRLGGSDWMQRRIDAAKEPQPK